MEQCTHLYEAFIAQGLWVFLGVIAGAFLNGLAKILKDFWDMQGVKKQIALELDYNIGRVKTWVQHLDECLSDVQSGVQPTRYFDFTKTFSPTFNQLFNSTKAYKFFNHDDLKQLLEMIVIFQEGSEKYANGQIQQLWEDKVAFNEFYKKLRQALVGSEVILTNMRKKF